MMGLRVSLIVPTQLCTSKTSPGTEPNSYSFSFSARSNNKSLSFSHVNFHSTNRVLGKPIMVLRSDSISLWASPNSSSSGFILSWARKHLPPHFRPKGFWPLPFVLDGHLPCDPTVTILYSKWREIDESPVA